MRQAAQHTLLARMCGIAFSLAITLVAPLAFAQDAEPIRINDPFGGNLPTYNAGATKISESKRKPTLQIQGPSKVHDHIERALSDSTAFVFIDTPLKEAVEKISTAHQIPMIVDQRALEELGMTPDIPVIIDLQNVSLRSALRLMLRSFELDYIIKDELLQITTPAMIKFYSYGMIYTLPASSYLEEDVVKSLQRILEAKFSQAGGPKPVVQYLRSNPVGSAPGKLMIEGNRDVHAEAKSKLLLLRDKAKAPVQSKN